jgi:hypothetical protein
LPGPSHHGLPKWLIGLDKGEVACRRWKAYLLNEGNILTDSDIIYAKPVGEHGVVLGAVHSNAESNTNVVVNWSGSVQIATCWCCALCTRQVVCSQLKQEGKCLGRDLRAEDADRTEGGTHGSGLREVEVGSSEKVDYTRRARCCDLVHAVSAVHGACCIKGFAQGLLDLRRDGMEACLVQESTEGGRNFFGYNGVKFLVKLGLQCSKIKSLTEGVEVCSYQDSQNIKRINGCTTRDQSEGAKYKKCKELLQSV